MISKVSLVGVCVRDQQKALQFYIEKLGFKVHTDVPMGPEMRWIEVAPKEGGVTLALFTPPGMEDRIGTYTGVCLTCDDVVKTYQELSARGVTFIEPPTKQSWGMHAQFVDQDGNSFVLAKEDKA